KGHRGAPTRSTPGPHSLTDPLRSAQALLPLRGASGRRLFAVRSHQRAHAVGGLRALAHPIVDARQIELELLLTAAGNRVEKPHVLQARTALALAAIGYHDVIEGLIARPAPREADGY